jgi:urease accessory protein UreF
VKVDRGRAALLLLADGRLPSGSHVHSGGIEAAVTDGRVHDHGSLGEPESMSPSRRRLG